MRDIMCTNCGCKKLIRTAAPFDVRDQYAKFVASPTLRIYACCECGHLEFFDPHAIDKYNESIRSQKSITSELQILRKRLSDLESPTAISKINDEIKQIERQLTSLDITIRQQQELQAKVRELQAKARTIPNEIAKIKRQIEALECKLKDAEEVLSNTEIIDG